MRAGARGKARRDCRADPCCWWDRARRALAWRAEPGETPDPYRVWLSEVLLQQTTAQAVTPYYRAFLEKWPTVEDLAAAPIEAVISAFAGLGYYSRARNLHACAKEIAGAGGRFPSDEAALRALPGVGAYTAAAIAAIAFDRQAAPVDGNIARILARVTGLDAPIAESRKAIAAAARALAPPRRAGDFAQALMDIGATHLPAPQPGLPGLPAESRLRRVPLRRAGDLSAKSQGEAEAAASRRRLLRASGGRRLPRPPAAAERPARLDRRASRARPGRARGRAGLSRMARRSRRAGAACPARSSRSSPISR